MSWNEWCILGCMIHVKMYDVCLDLWYVYAKLINVCMSQLSDNAKWHDNAKVNEIKIIYILPWMYEWRCMFVLQC